MTEETLYYVRRQGRVEGPWPLEKLQSEVQVRKLARYHHVSLDGRSWFPAGNVQELFPRLQLAAQAASSDDGSPSEEPAWYYSENNAPVGPVPFSELVARLESGKMSPQDLVWREGMEDWKAACQVPELAEIASASRNAGADMTVQTRMVNLSPRPARSTGFIQLAAVITGMVALLSCIPLLGVLGAIPFGMGMWSLIKGRTDERVIAMLVVAFGALEVLWGIASAVGLVLYFL